MSTMTRRAFFMSGGAFLLTPRGASAQQANRVYRVGVISTVPAPLYVAAWEQGLRELGWSEGKNIVLEYRSSHGRYELYPTFAAELVRLKVDVILAVTDLAVQAAREATSTIPIVMGLGTDPIAAGLVASLAPPGGQITAMPMFADELAGKMLELLKEMVPRTSRVSVITERTGSGPRTWSAAQTGGGKFGLTLEQLPVGPAEDLDIALATIAKHRPDALVVTPNTTAYFHLPRLADFSASNTLPTMYPFREAVEAGGLIAYNPPPPAAFSRRGGAH